MLIIKKLLLILLCLFFSNTLSCQIDGTIVELLLNKSKVLKDYCPTQNIYIQTSKGIYETGEDLWFKGYVLNSTDLTPSTQDKTLFVQLVNDSTQEVVWEEKYEIDSGFANGHILLEDSLQEGTYSLLAYSPNSFYNVPSSLPSLRKLKIVKRIRDKLQQKKVGIDSAVDFRMFPEGGYLVSGLKSTLAFKCVNSHGLPLNVSGTLFEDNKPLLQFKTVHAGMGSFQFTPDFNKKYHVEILDSLEIKHYPLPTIENDGIVIRLIENNDDYLMVVLSSSKKVPRKQYYLQLKVRGEVYSLAASNTEKSLRIKIPLKDVPQGIAELTVFNENFEPTCERLVYVKPNEKLYIKTTLNGREFNTREQIIVKLKVTGQNGCPKKAHLGLSIHDILYKNPNDPKNILTHYYLSSQLRGSIHDPSYYFNEKIEDREQSLDLLLLTQGWRRYVWNSSNLVLFKDKKQVIFDNIQGEILFPKKHQNSPQNLLPALMVFSSKNENIKSLVFTDSSGKFKVTPRELSIDKQLYLKLMTSEKSNHSFNVRDHSFKTINSLTNLKEIDYPSTNSFHDKSNETLTFLYPETTEVLEEVVLSSRKRIVNRDKYLGKLDSIAKFELTTDFVCPHNYLNCPQPHQLEDLQKPVEGKVYQELKVWNGESFQSGIPIIMGSPFINPSLPPYTYPAITDEYLMSRFNLAKVKGYYGNKEFYSPKYDLESLNDPFPDYRNTLFWKSDIVTDENGEATITFNCSDINTRFVGTIEGVDSTGLLGNQEFDFFVRKKD